MNATIIDIETRLLANRMNRYRGIVMTKCQSDRHIYDDNPRYCSECGDPRPDPGFLDFADGDDEVN